MQYPLSQATQHESVSLVSMQSTPLQATKTIDLGTLGTPSTTLGTPSAAPSSSPGIDGPMEYAQPMQAEGSLAVQGFIDLVEQTKINEINGKSFGGPTHYLETMWASLPTPKRNAYCHWLP